MTQRWFASLRVRLVLVVVIAIVPLMGVMLYNRADWYQQAADDARQYASRTLYFVSRVHNELIAGTHQLLTVLTQLPAVRERDAAACNTLFSDLLAQYPAYTGLAAATSEGDVFCSAPTTETVNFADRAWFQQSLQTKDFTIGEYLLDRVSGQTTVVLAEPALDATGHVQAIVAAGLDLSFFTQLADEAELPPGATLTMSDRNGTILAQYPDGESLVGESMQETAVFRAALAQGGEGTVTTKGMDAVERLYAFAPLPGVPRDAGFYAFVGIPTDAIFGPVEEAQTRTLVTIGLVTVLGLAAALLFSELSILRRVGALMNATRRLAAGDLTARTGQAYGRGEISQLARAFDDMAASLEVRTEQLSRANRVLKALTACNQALVRASDESDLLRDICEAIVDAGGYHMVWVGFAEHDAAKSVRPVAHAGSEEGYLETLRITWADEERGRGPTGSAIRTGEPQTVHDMLTSAAFAPWREEATRRGFASSVALPLVVKGEPAGALNIYAAEPDAFDEGEMQLLSEIASDMAFGLETLRARAARERTERALGASEDRFRQVFQASTDAISIGDIAQGRYLDVNKAFLTMTGYTRKEVIGKTSMELGIWVDPEDSTRLPQRVRARKSVREKEFEFRRKDGSTGVCLLSAQGVEIGGAEYLMCSIRDITEYKGLQEQFLQAQKMESVGRLAGGVAHDFNNALTVIQGYACFALEALPPDAPERADIQEVLKSADHAANLTRQLLAFSRSQILQPKVINLNDLILNMGKMLRRLTRENIELVTLPTPDLDAVYVDPGQMEQILVNLVVNASDAMPEGGTLTIETANVTLDEDYALAHLAISGDYVMLAVSDTGVGMTDEVKKRIFEPFFTTKEKGKGTGLGLATVYGIVNQHGGNIYVYSEPGQGSTFKVYLPRATGEAVELPIRVHQGDLPRGHETVLVVEDEPAVRRLAVRALQRRGYTVLEAENGADALRIAREHGGDIHLLLADVVMPLLGGKRLADELRVMRPDVKCIFFSGYTDNAIVHQGVLDAGTAFIQKPFTAATLARKVREVLDGD